MVAFLVRMLPTLAPVLIVEAAVAPSFIGYLAAIGTVGSMLFYLAGTPLVRRLGPVRIMQLGMLVAAAGTALLGVPVPIVLALGSLLIGFGYAPSTPAGSDVLQRFAPKRHRTLLFSIKQAGVPFGGMIAGVILPPLTLIDWRLAILVSVALTLAVTAAIQPLRARIDRDRNRTQDLSPSTFLAPENLLMPLHALRMSPRIPPLILASICLAAAQGATFAFLVTFMVGIGLDLTAAGALFAIVQVTGIFGRILFGGLADRFGSATAMLVAAALSSAITTAIFAYAAPDWPYWWLVLLAGVVRDHDLELERADAGRGRRRRAVRARRRGDLGHHAAGVPRLHRRADRLLADPRRHGLPVGLPVPVGADGDRRRGAAQGGAPVRSCTPAPSPRGVI